MNKRILGGLAAVVLLMGGLFVTQAVPVSAAVDHCPDHTINPKDESGASSNLLVLAAGSSFCAKGSTGNSGKRTADGETTLIEYTALFAPPNGGGNVPNVSYYVVYQTSSEPEVCEFNEELSADDEGCVEPEPEVCEFNEELSADDEGCVEPEPEVCEYNDQLPASDKDCTPPVVPTPEPEIPVVPPVVVVAIPPNASPTTREVVVAALPPAQAPTTTAPAPVVTIPAAGLPATGSNGTGVAALIALLVTSLGGAALLAARRRNVTT